MKNKQNVPRRSPAESGDSLTSRALDLLLDEAAARADAAITKETHEAAKAADIRFSAKHEAQMEELFRRERRKIRMQGTKRHAKAAACVLLAVLVGGATLIGSVDAWRSRVISLVFDPTQPGSDIFMLDKTKNTFIKGDLHLNYIPEGFSLIEESSSDKYIHLSFANGSECFGVSCVPSGTQSYIDTEDATKESVIVNGYEAYWVENPRVRYLIWANDDWVFTIDTDLIGLYNPIDRSTMLKIAWHAER